MHLSAITPVTAPMFAATTSALLAWGIRGGVLLLLAALAARLAGSRSAAFRHRLWGLALIGLLATPWVPSLAPQWQLSWPTPPRVEQDNIVRATNAHPTPAVLNTWAARSAEPIAPPPRRTPDHRARATVVVLWLVGVLLLALRQVASHRRVGRIIARARPLLDPIWRARVADAARTLGGSPDVTLCVSDHVAIPITCGWRTARIVLPVRCAEWSDARARAVLLHELAHARRGDLAWHTMARVACALCWFQPLTWLAAARLRDEAEHACDDAALAGGELPSGFAQTLLAFASEGDGHAPASALAFARRPSVERRIAAVLAPHSDRRALSRAEQLPLLALGLSFALIVALPSARPAGAGADNSVVPARVQQAPGAPITIDSASAHMSAATRDHTGETDVVRVSAPRLDLTNHDSRRVAAVLVRLEILSYSSDAAWHRVSIAPNAHARLELPGSTWSNQVPRRAARELAVSIDGVRYSDGSTWPADQWAEFEPPNDRAPKAIAPGDLTPSPLPGREMAAPQPAPVARPSADSRATPSSLQSPAELLVTPTPSAPRAPSAQPAHPGAASTPLAAPTPPTDSDVPLASLEGALVAEMRNPAGAPVVIQQAFAPRVSGQVLDDFGSPATPYPVLTLLNQSKRRVTAVRLRFKADAESHAVTVLNSTIEPGSMALYRRAANLRGRAEDMKVQVLGVKFADGSVWGTLDSRIETRQVWIDVAGGR